MGNPSITCPYKKDTPEHKDWWQGLDCYFFGLATGFKVHLPEWTEGYNAGEEICSTDWEPFFDLLGLNVTE